MERIFLLTERAGDGPNKQKPRREAGCRPRMSEQTMPPLRTITHFQYLLFMGTQARTGTSLSSEWLW